MKARRKLKLRNKFIILLCLSLFFLAMYTLMKYTLNPEIDRETLLRQMELSIAKENDSLLCKPPNLPLYPPEIMKFVHEVHPIDCTSAGMNWVKCKGSICSIQEEAKNAYGPIRCVFTDLVRVNDYENTEGKTTVTEDTYQLIESDVVRVSCKAENKKWSTVLTSIRKNDTIWRESSWGRTPKKALNMNVLMFGVDSVSRNLFMRKLPQTYNYITKNLKGIVLKGYNIVGDGTPQALIPMLTGKTELELPDTRKRFDGTEFVNSYPFIWNDFKKAGYVTGFLEDLPSTGIFTYRLNGFKETPTDHYMRPYYLSEESEQKKWPKLCTANTPRHKVMTNFIKDFYQSYQAKPKFMFGFHGELSHDDYNLVGAADKDFKTFLQDLNESNLLNNTVLVIFADHGHRFAEIRNTLQGKQEERLPFFSITLPSWFYKKHPKLYKALKINAERLATPFDIHATLSSLLNVDINENVNRNTRSISLFSEIPTNRTCSQAFIEPHWCACLTWHPLETNHPIIPYLSKTLLATLNNYTSQYRNLCDVWKLAKVNWASRLIPNENLVKFKQNSDRDGFAADLSADTTVDIETYQINVVLMPDGALFEASVNHKLVDDSFSVRISDISRINMYGRQARCIEENYPHLRKFCHCKD